jgi:hypothetical protein
LGWKASPRRPSSPPVDSRLSLSKNGRFAVTPFSMMRILPRCSTTNSRLRASSGATTSRTGRSNPEAAVARVTPRAMLGGTGTSLALPGGGVVGIGPTTGAGVCGRGAETGRVTSPVSGRSA